MRREETPPSMGQDAGLIHDIPGAGGCRSVDRAGGGQDRGAQAASAGRTGTLMPNRPLDVLLAGLTLLTPVTIHLFFPVIPAVKADFSLSDAMAQLTFSVGVFALAFSTLVYGCLLYTSPSPRD